MNCRLCSLAEWSSDYIRPQWSPNWQTRANSYYHLSIIDHLYVDKEPIIGKICSELSQWGLYQHLALGTIINAHIWGMKCELFSIVQCVLDGLFNKMMDQFGALGWMIRRKKPCGVNVELHVFTFMYSAYRLMWCIIYNIQFLSSNPIIQVMLISPWCQIPSSQIYIHCWIFLAEVLLC